MHRRTAPFIHHTLRKEVAAAATALLAASGVAVAAASTATAVPLPTVVINEVESNCGTSAD